MPEIEEYGYLYKLSTDCVVAYNKGGFENNSELASLMQQLVDHLVKIDGIVRELIYAGAKAEMENKWDKYAWLCTAIEFVNQKCGFI